jgi:23S rRNA (cytosine1962-C5)-methyltransferase
MQYELIDFGNARKLERFGPYVVDRPCPTAEGTKPRAAARWPAADARFERLDAGRGRWQPAGRLPESWVLGQGALRFELRAAPSGQVGVFPEQAENWQWIADRLAEAAKRVPTIKVLNLFAYTGGATLAAAAAGAEVVHVDAARSAVAWARRNAARSALAEAPIRWLVEDAGQFVRREVRRGNRYHAVILDPPTYGHGPKGQPWQVRQQLGPLLADCAKLAAESFLFILLTCHTPGFSAADLRTLLTERLSGTIGSPVTARRLMLRTADGRQLPSGVVVRWPELSARKA